MKKLLGIVVLFLILISNSQAFTMKGIDEVEIAIEKNNSESEKVCNLYERDVKTSLEYIVSNSRLKIGTNKNSDKMIPVLYVGGGITHNNSICVGAVILKLDRLSIDDPLGKGNIGMFTYFDRNAFMSASHSEFKQQYLTFLEQLAKEFIVEWNKNNQ